MDDATLAKLKTYQTLLKKWQPKINLISNKTLDNVWQRHFEDSIQIAELVPKTTKTLFDLGSGAGFPGLVIAAMRPAVNVSLVESDQKKSSFLRTVSREADIKAHIMNERIENVSHETLPDAITARALASLDELFIYCQRWIDENPAITLIFPKGAQSEIELSTLEKHWNFDLDKVKSRTNDAAQILVFTNINAILLD